MTTFRRVIVLAALLFWQGGGAFYGAFAIPIGRRDLGDQAFLQSVITRDATNILNQIGVGALAVILVDLVVRGARCPARIVRAASWFGMALGQGALVFLHARLAAVYDGDSVHVPDGRSFRLDHKLYLLVTLAQFLSALVFLAASMHAWRVNDIEEGKRLAA